jgi:hypothetical protein
MLSILGRSNVSQFSHVGGFHLRHQSAVIVSRLHRFWYTPHRCQTETLSKRTRCFLTMRYTWFDLRLGDFNVVYLLRRSTHLLGHNQILLLFLLLLRLE